MDQHIFDLRRPYCLGIQNSQRIQGDIQEENHYTQANINKQAAYSLRYIASLDHMGTVGKGQHIHALWLIAQREIVVIR